MGPSRGVDYLIIALNAFFVFSCVGAPRARARARARCGADRWGRASGSFLPPGVPLPRTAPTLPPPGSCARVQASPALLCECER